MPKAGRAGKIAIRDHKIKQLGALHPNSRKAAQKHGELLHDDKKALHVAARDMKWKTQLQKFAWFQKAVWMDDKKVYTPEEMLSLVKEYVTRNDDQINEAIAEASIGGGSGKIAITSNIGQKQKVREFEAREFAQRELIAPDLTRPKIVRAVKEWKTGNVDQMQLIKTEKFGDEAGVGELGSEPDQEEDTELQNMSDP